MSEVLDAKSKLATEVKDIRDLLAEVCQRLAKLPRSTVATRQLSLILSKMDQWLAEFGPKPAVDESEPNRDEIDDALSAYRDRGFVGLTVRQRFIIEWFDRNYRMRPFHRTDRNGVSSRASV